MYLGSKNSSKLVSLNSTNKKVGLLNFALYFNKFRIWTSGSKLRISSPKFRFSFVQALSTVSGIFKNWVLSIWQIL